MKLKSIFKQIVTEAKLLGTSPTEERIVKLISQYYYGSTITLSDNGDGTYDVHNKNGKINSVRVVKKGDKFRFERV